MAKVRRAKGSTEILDHSPEISDRVTARLDGIPYVEKDSTPSAERQSIKIALADEQNWLCFYCCCVMINDPARPSAPNALTFDHIKLKSEGGRFSKKNGVAACYACNQNRGNLPFDLYCEIVNSRS